MSSVHDRRTRAASALGICDCDAGDRPLSTAVLGTAKRAPHPLSNFGQKTTTGGTNVHGDGQLRSANSAVYRGPLVHAVGATVEACACNGLMYRYVAGTWPTIRGGDDEALSSL